MSEKTIHSFTVSDAGAGKLGFTTNDPVMLGSVPSFFAPNQLVLQDEAGQPWAISVRPDGQLQTAKYELASGDA